MIPLRPLRFGEILDSSFRLYRATFVEVAILVAVTLGAFQALATVLQGPQPALTDLDAFAATDPIEQSVRLLAAGGVAVLSVLFVEPLVRGAVTGMALERDRGGDHSWQAGLRLGLRLAGRLLGLAFLLLFLGMVLGVALVLVVVVPTVLFAESDLLLVAVLWGVGSGALAIAVLLVATALIRLAVPVVVVEHVGAWTALRRSYALVRPQLLRIVGITVLTVLLVGVVSGVASAGAVAFAFLGGVVAVVGTIVLSVLTLIVTLPLEANIALLLYVDARVRIEGLDVAVLTAELDAA